MNAVQFWIVDTIVKVNPALGYHDVKRSSPSPSSTPTTRHADDAIAVSINEQDERTPLLR